MPVSRIPRNVEFYIPYLRKTFCYNLLYLLFSVSAIRSASLSVDGFYRGVPVDKNGYFSFSIPFCPRKIVIRASAKGYVSTMKVLDIPSDSLGVVENIQVVLFRLADPVLVVAGEENVLKTSGAARIIIPAGTTFLDENGNEAGGNVNAILNFIDPSNANFDDSPGVFVTDRGDELMSFGVLNLRFQDDDGNALTPRGDIRIALADTDATDYKLWLLNNDGGWTEKRSRPTIAGPAIARPSFLRRNRRQAGGDDLGGFGVEDIGRWINIDKVPNAQRCYIKTRVFEDVSFINEVVNNGVDQYQPKFLLKIGNSAPFQGLNLYRPPTYSPGQTCYEVRCGENPKIKGYVSVLTQETIGNGQSIPFPAIPIHLGNPALPAALDTELANLNYQVNPTETEASLYFKSSSTGPLYDDQTVCEKSTPSENSLWFARRKPVFTNTDFGSDVCYARVMVYHRGPGGAEYLDQLQGTSVWGNDPYYYADSIVQSEDFANMTYHEFACLRYRCSEPGDLTTVHLDTFVTNENVTCYTNEFMPPVLDPANPVYGYYFGADEDVVREECLAADDPEKTVSYVSCYMRQGGADGSTRNSTGV